MKKTLLAIVLGALLATAQAAPTEDFADVPGLSAAGWILTNNSIPTGTTDWAQGDTNQFTAQAGADNSYISANFNNAGPGGQISNWLITPTFSTSSAGSVSFWARAAADPAFSDMLEYGLTDASGALGTFSLAAAFTVPTDAWTEYVLNFAGTGTASSARFAIHYTGAADNANYVGVDSLTVGLPAIGLPEPATPLMLGVGLLGLLAARRRKQQ